MEEAIMKLQEKYSVEISVPAVNLAVCGLRSFAPAMFSEDDGDHNNNAAVGILDEACKMVVENFRNCAHEIEFNDKAYELRRALVELNELHREEVDLETRIWVDRLRAERDSASSYLNEFLYTWDFRLRPIVDLHFRERLETYRTYASNIISSSNRRSESSPESHDVVSDVRRFLDDIYEQLMDRFRCVLTVEDRHVAQVMSRLSDVPITHILNLHKERAISMIKQRLVNQEHLIDEIFQVLEDSDRTSSVNAMRPRGSFILLGPSGVGKTEIAKAVARHWYGDANRLVEIDMAEYEELLVTSTTTSRWLEYLNDLWRRLSEIDLSEYEELLMRSMTSHLSECWLECRNDIRKRLSEIVERRPYTVFVLDNIHKVSSTIIKILLEILSCGKPSDIKGKAIDLVVPSDIKGEAIDFSKSIIFMTCNVGCKSRGARKLITADLLDSVDKILVVETTHDQNKSVARLMLREVARDIYGEKIVVHASNAAIDALFLRSKKQDLAGKAFRQALLEHVIPRLPPAAEATGYYNGSVCIDTLVGTHELTFRNHTRGQHVGNLYYEFSDGVFEMFVGNIKSKMEAVVSIVFGFREAFLFVCMLSNSAAQSQLKLLLGNLLLVICDVFSSVDSCRNRVLSPAFQDANAQLKLLSGKLLIVVCDALSSDYSNLNPFLKSAFEKPHGDTQIASHEDNLPTVEEKDKFSNHIMELGKNNATGVAAATVVILHALVRMSDASLQLPDLPPRYFLFEGLDNGATTSLIDFLTQLLGNSLFTYVKLDENCRGNRVRNILINRVRRRSCMVFLIDGIEFADDVLYKSLLEIFDKGTTKDYKGYSVEFWRSIIILASNVANKYRIAATLFKHNKEETQSKIAKHKENLRRFRTELLYRLDQIIFFDPTSPEHGRIHTLSLSSRDFKKQGLSNSLLQMFKA